MAGFSNLQTAEQNLGLEKSNEEELK